MKTIIALIALSITTTTFAADLNVQIHKTITLKKVAKDVYEKINEVTVTNRNLLLNNGQPNKSSFKDVNADRMTYTLDQNLLRIQDEKEGVDVEMGVVADRSLFGKLRSFTVAGDKIEKAYADSLTRKGITSLRDLDLKAAERKSLVVGNQVCTVEKSSELLTCEQEITLKVTNNGAILTAALFILDAQI